MEKVIARVLVIEDDPDTRQVIRLILEHNGYRVLEAHDGLSGLARLRTHLAPLVVVLDWLMPRMDGLEVLRALAADVPFSRRHVFILATALYDAPELRLADLPPDLSVSLLGKPFDSDKLLRAVADAEKQLAAMPWTTQNRYHPDLIER